jgi:hypothetical protein
MTDAIQVALSGDFRLISLGRECNPSGLLTFPGSESRPRFIGPVSTGPEMQDSTSIPGRVRSEVFKMSVGLA